MEKIQQNSEIQNLMKFLDKSVTNYHAVQEVCTQLDEQGFVQLKRTVEIRRGWGILCDQK